MANNKRQIAEDEGKRVSKRLRQTQHAATPLSHISILEHLPISTSTPRRAMPRQGSGPSPLPMTRQYPFDSLNDSVSSLGLKKQQEAAANKSKNVSKQAKITDSFNKTSRIKVSKSKENIPVAKVDVNTDAAINKSKTVDEENKLRNVKSKKQDVRVTETSTSASQEVSVDNTASIGHQDLRSKSVTLERSDMSERSRVRRSERSLLSTVSSTPGPRPMPITGQYPSQQSFNRSKSKTLPQKTTAGIAAKTSKSNIKGNQSKINSYLNKTKDDSKLTQNRRQKSKNGSENEDTDVSKKSKQAASRKKNSANSKKPKSPSAKANTTRGRKATEANNKTESQAEMANKFKTKERQTKNKNLGPKKTRGEEENLIQERARKTNLTKKKQQPLSESNEEDEAPNEEDEAPNEDEAPSVNEKSKLSFSERMASKTANQRYRNMKLSERVLKQWKPLSKENLAYISAVMKSNAQKTVYQCKQKHQTDVQKFLSYYKHIFITTVSSKGLPRSACKDYEKLEQMIDDMESVDEDLDERMKDVEKAIGREERLLEDQEERLQQLQNKLGLEQKQTPESGDEESELEVTLDEDPLAKSINEKVYALIGEMDSG